MRKGGHWIEENCQEQRRQGREQGLVQWRNEDAWSLEYSREVPTGHSAGAGRAPYSRAVLTGQELGSGLRSYYTLP